MVDRISTNAESLDRWFKILKVGVNQLRIIDLFCNIKLIRTLFSQK